MANLEKNLQNRLSQHDFNRHLSIFFAPSNKRSGLKLLLELDFELAKIANQITDPLLGRIKLQFWRDAIGDPYGSGLPLARQLHKLVKTDVDYPDRLEQLIAVYEDAIEHAETHETSRLFEGETCLFELFSFHLDSDACTELEGGVFGRCGALYGELLQKRIQIGSSEDAPLQKQASRQRIGENYARLRTDLNKLSPESRSAFLPLALVPSYLELFESVNDIDTGGVDVHPLKKVWYMWRAARSGF